MRRGCEAVVPLLALCALCAIAVLPESTVRDVLATAAATLFEAAPFVLAAYALNALLPQRFATLVPLIGCGCGGGPSARSLPAAAATWLAFGPFVALARFAAALATSRILHRHPNHCHPERSPQSGRSRRAQSEAPLATLAAIVPFGILAGVTVHALSLVAQPDRMPVAAAFALGVAGGFTLAPCGLGVVGIAGALRAVASATAAGFLCVAGILDARTLFERHAHRASHDGFAYALAAVACAIAAWHGGGTLVHPRFVPALWCCAIALAYLAFRYRTAYDVRAAIAPAVMFAGVVLGAPAPHYRATATTLGDAFAGERLTFEGVVTRAHGTTALVRYAITCCRADAAPIVVRLANDRAGPSTARLRRYAQDDRVERFRDDGVERFRDGTWVHADGVLDARNGMLELRVEHASPIAPPIDPFIYR